MLESNVCCNRKEVVSHRQIHDDEGSVTVRAQEKLKDAPEASVVIPVYRGAQYVAQALRSVFAQTFTQYEVIVVNDGSPETELIESEISPYQQRITYLNQANGGPSAARNAGVLRSRGTYIAFLDADDAWYPD